ncbi:hypothetical protein MRX96_015250 [Rhipicephalus microplus]
MMAENSKSTGAAPVAAVHGAAASCSCALEVASRSPATALSACLIHFVQRRAQEATLSQEEKDLGGI